MKFILAKKNSMTEVFTEEGKVVPATLLDAGPVVVTQVKDEAKDGYKSVQVGFGNRKERNIRKPQLGHMKKLGNFECLREFRGETGELKVGDKIEVSVFAPGDAVQVSGTSKGKGFQGVVKRHGFKGGPRTHGQKHSEREAGSIGGGGRAGGRVAKGMRMAGRMGGERVTVKNLEVVQVVPEANQILIRGAVPGRRGTVLEIRSI